MVEEKFDLSPKQREIVEYIGSKPMSVEAGPGAGKTRVIVERVKFLVNKMKVRPESLLVITFIRKAAEELKKMLVDSAKDSLSGKMYIASNLTLCGQEVRDIDIAVWGSFSNYILPNYYT